MLMYSATYSPAVLDLAMKNMVNHIFITTGTIGSTNLDVQQRFLEVTRNEKKDKLCEELRNIGNAKTIVFADTKKTADFLASFLSQKDFKVIVDYFFIELLDFLIISLFQKATSIHGDRLQSQRELALREFRQGIRNVLVATNVAARGLGNYFCLIYFTRCASWSLLSIGIERLVSG